MAESKLNFIRRHWLPALLMLALALLPLAANALGQGYYITFASRVLVIAIAAVGLNLALGYGGMVSFGHALYVGLGAYVVAVMSSHLLLAECSRLCWAWSRCAPAESLSS